MHRTCFSVFCAILLVCAFAAPAYAGEATVPDVVGLSLDEARGLLDAAGFSATIENVQGQRIGFVVSQSPGGFATRDTSGAITLKVGGPTPKPGMDMPPAGPGMTPMGDAPMGDSPTGPAPTADTPREAPAASSFSWNGKALPPGRLPGTDGPEMPSVLGQSVERARGVLRRWNVTVENTLAVPQLAGTIVNQWPPAGANLTAGETVTVVVAITERPSNDHRYVPQAERRSWRDAISLVERSGFVPRPVSVVSSASERGLIVAQSPQPGSMALGGQSVRLFVGRGPSGYSADVQPTEPTAPMPDTPPAGPTPVKPDGDLPPAGTGSMPIEPGADTPRPTPTEPSPAGPAPAGPTPTEPKPPADTTTASIGTPSLSNPPAGESYPFKYGADFKWSSVRGAASYDIELQEELPSGAWQTASTTSVTGTTHRPARIERGRYRWRVRGVTAEGHKGRWSEYRRLYMY